MFLGLKVAETSICLKLKLSNLSFLFKSQIFKLRPAIRTGKCVWATSTYKTMSRHPSQNYANVSSSSARRLFEEKKRGSIPVYQHSVSSTLHIKTLNLDTSRRLSTAFLLSFGGLSTAFLLSFGGTPETSHTIIFFSYDWKLIATCNVSFVYEQIQISRILNFGSWLCFDNKLE